MLTAFGTHDRIDPFLASILEPLGPEGVEITQRVVEFVNNMRVGVLGAVGVAGLFYTVLSLIILWVRRPRRVPHLATCRMADRARRGARRSGSGSRCPPWSTSPRPWRPRSRSSRISSTILSCVLAIAR